MKKWVIALIMIIVLTNISYISYASSPNTIDGLFPDIETLDINSTQPKNFEKYPLTHYMFDTEKFGILDSWASVITALTNFLFFLTVLISYAVNYLLMACYKFNLFKLIATIFNSLIWAIRDAVLIPLVGPLLAIVGISLIFNAAVAKFTTVWRIVTNALLVIVVAGFFLGNPALFVDMVNQASESISGDVLATTSSIATGSRLTADDAVVNLGNTFWETTVVKPWQLIQFGNTDMGEAEMDNYLQYSLSAPQRKSMADNMGKAGNELFKPIGAVIRLGMVAFIGIVTLAINLLVGIIAALTTMLQFGAIISAMIMIIAFMVALLPNMGFRVALHGLMNTFGFLLGKIGLTILLSMYFSLNVAIYRLISSYGWFFVTLMQLILIVTIVVYRKKIMGFAYSVTSGQQRAIENIHSKPDIVKDAQRTAVKAYAAKKMYDDVSRMRDMRKDRKLTEEYKPLAEEYLMHRYTNEKKTAEARARKEEKEVEYSDFVKQVDSRVDKGFNFFDEREIDRTTEMMKELHRQGNDPKNLLTTKIEGNKDNKVRMKQLELERQVEAEKDSLEYRQVSNADKINKNIRSEKESKLYDKDIEKQVKREEKEAENSKLFAEYPEAAVTMTHGVDNIILSQRSTGALDELRRDKLERDYVEMKKIEYDTKEIKNVKEEELALEEKQVVNGGVSQFNRPLGSPVSRGARVRSQVELNQEHEVPEVESTNSKMNKDLISVEKSTINREHDGLKNVVSENKNIKNEQSTREVIENAVNKNESRVETNKNLTNASEGQVNRTNNTTNESSNVNAITENIRNEERKVENVVENAVNKNESRVETNKNLTNASEGQVNRTNNTTNESSNVNAITENIKNEERKVENVVENVVNKNESKVETSKNITNSSEGQVNRTNNITNESNNVNAVTENIRNEERKVENVVENVVNRRNNILDIQNKLDKIIPKKDKN